MKWSYYPKNKRVGFCKFRTGNYIFHGFGLWTFVWFYKLEYRDLE